MQCCIYTPRACPAGSARPASPRRWRCKAAGRQSRPAAMRAGWWWSDRGPGRPAAEAEGRGCGGGRGPWKKENANRQAICMILGMKQDVFAPAGEVRLRGLRTVQAVVPSLHLLALACTQNSRSTSQKAPDSAAAKFDSSSVDTVERMVDTRPGNAVTQN